MKLFQRDIRKEYLRHLKDMGIKYGKEEKKEIKKLLKTDVKLDEFKLCILPMIDEEKMKKQAFRRPEIISDNIILPLKAEQIREMRRGFENGLSYEEVELYKNPRLDSRNMKAVRENIERKGERYIEDIGPVHKKMSDKEMLNIRYAVSKYRDKSLEAFMKLQELKKGKSGLIGISQKKELEKIIGDIPKEEKSRIVITERLAETISLDVLKDLKENDAKVFMEWMNERHDEIGEIVDYTPQSIEEVYEMISRNDLAKEYSREKKETHLKIAEEMTRDSDNDGLTDYEEKYIYNTNEHSRDSDGDGKSDFEEIKMENTNPRDSKEKKQKNKKDKEKELER